MKLTHNLSKVAYLFVAILTFSACNKERNNPLNYSSVQSESDINPSQENWSVIPGKYIVVLNKENLNKSQQLDVTKEYQERLKIVRQETENLMSELQIKNFSTSQIYQKALIGFAVKLSDDDLERLKKSSKVSFIEPDRIVSLGKPGGGGSIQPVEQIPWGVQRVGFANGTGKTAWVIDTGVDLDHPDLNVDTGKSKSFIPTRPSPDDENGHGTHVAGTIAAIDNEIGVVGVASGATIISIRVLDRRGSGALSDVIAGVDYVGGVANTGDAANMSLGGGISQALDIAVIAASQEGIYFAIAAGNSKINANNSSPARANGNNIFTVSAMDINNIFASFSNYGNPPVDYCAPGVAIYSTWKGGSYNTLNGTSMAAPHVTGLLLLNGHSINSDGYVINDPDGNPDLIAHK